VDVNNESGDAGMRAALCSDGHGAVVVAVPA
jgi:hypothetical protein